MKHIAKDESPYCRRVLVVEDEYYLASMLALSLQIDGFDVIGPAGSVHRALELLHGHDAIDCALLDLNLRGEPAYPVADALMERQVPFLFLTGYARHSLPARYAGVPLQQKPVEGEQLALALAELLAGGTTTPTSRLMPGRRASGPEAPRIVT